MATPFYQLVPNRSVCHQMYLINHVLQYEGFAESAHLTNCTRNELTAAYRILPKRSPNVAGMTVEIPFTYGHMFEIGLVGPCLMSGNTLAVHGLRVSACNVNGRFIHFEPAYEKLLLLPSSQTVTQVLEPRPQFPVLSDAIVHHLQNFAQGILGQFRGSDRVHDIFHVNIVPSYPHAIPVMSPQQTLLNYVEVTHARLRPAVESIIQQRMGEDDLMEVGIEDAMDSDFDLFNETLVNQFPEQFGDASMEDMVTAYIAYRYRPTSSLPFVGHDDVTKSSVADADSTGSDGYATDASSTNSETSIFAEDGSGKEDRFAAEDDGAMDDDIYENDS
ncbi:unnamed protein product [Peniophora sp. CBMAI 1063]|nr:unnamed protein product [Peniophora sp. CBMAI 1063]